MLISNYNSKKVIVHVIHTNHLILYSIKVLEEIIKKSTCKYLFHQSSDAFCKSIEGEILVLRSGAAQSPLGRDGRPAEYFIPFFIFLFSSMFELQ